MTIRCWPRSSVKRGLSARAWSGIGSAAVVIWYPSTILALIIFRGNNDPLWWVTLWVCAGSMLLIFLFYPLMKRADRIEKSFGYTTGFKAPEYPRIDRRTLLVLREANEPEPSGERRQELKALMRKIREEQRAARRVKSTASVLEQGHDVTEHTGKEVER